MPCCLALYGSVLQAAQSVCHSALCCVCSVQQGHAGVSDAVQSHFMGVRLQAMTVHGAMQAVHDAAWAAAE